ncbi:two component histidine kinase 1 [Xylariaceae sp. FL0804]|nr:two component histidine kinase 1 [Xylariaceae sp. FL0804]
MKEKSPFADDGEFCNPLPGDKALWEKSSVGPAADWPKTLQAHSVTVSSFPYPAAIFWGEELVLLHNEAWQQSGGIAEQGQKQRGSLSPDSWKALSSSFHGKKPIRIGSRHILRNDSDEDEHNVLVSPLFADGDDPRFVTGVMAQLLPKSDAECEPRRRATPENRRPAGPSDINSDPLNLSRLGESVDNLPLDQHPFFHRFAEMLPSGLAILDQKARAVFVNQHFYELTTHRGEDQSFKSWPQSIHPDDYDRVMEAYNEAFTGQKQLRTEFRALGHKFPWRLLLLTPLGDENLQHVSLREYGGFICSVVDISSEKSAEITERQAAEEAKERREQQERFIDMISHEIRNPLSAILHCTEDIEEAIRPDRRDQDNKIQVHAIEEALESINMCISHQQNIVNDVLSFSKLDASMLSLRLKPCDPNRQLAMSLKMFQPEFRKQEIKFDYRIDTSYEKQGVSYVMADFPRIGQIVVNLVSNAVKFTARNGGDKEIVISIGASAKRPTSYPPNVVFFDSDETAYRMDATNSAEWGDEEVLYFMCAVKDSGIGISNEGQKRLFERFRQATPKTEETYGGSGLGLNISRKLCHLHGGEIGVSAKEGDGSTFGFFVKVRRTATPGDDEFDGNTQIKLESQITAAGNVPPKEMEPDEVPPSLDQPPVTREMNTRTWSGNLREDGRYQTSKDNKARVLKQEDREKDDSQGPKTYAEGSEGHRSGTAAGASSGGAERNDENQPPSGQPEKDQERRTHILLVEDNVINQRILSRKLEGKGFRVTTANNGREAVDAVQGAPNASTGDSAAFDIILMDSEMPILDGNSAAREIRRLEKDGKVERIPILGVTANVRDAQQDSMISAGMDDVIAKPYRVEDMVKRLAALSLTDHASTAAQSSETK